MGVREKLVELIVWIEDQMTRAYPYTTDQFRIETTVDHLIANDVTVQEWIPVTERLPEQGERVLATDGEFVGELYVNSRGKWKRYNDNDYSLMMALDILWWMPLPEPPKDGV